MAGQAALIVAAAFGTIGLLVAKRVPTPAHWAWHSAYSMLSGGLVLTACAFLAGEPGRLVWAAVPAQAWGGLAYLVFVGSCLGFSAFSFLTQAARPALVATISYVIPVLATLLGAVVLAERVTPSVLGAAVLIVGSVALVATGGRRRAAGA
jgi:drug/metabolite transporter (DMT)-like permease